MSTCVDKLMTQMEMETFWMSLIREGNGGLVCRGEWENCLQGVRWQHWAKTHSGLRRSEKLVAQNQIMWHDGNPCFGLLGFVHWGKCVILVNCWTMVEALDWMLWNMRELWQKQGTLKHFCAKCKPLTSQLEPWHALCYSLLFNVSNRIYYNTTMITCHTLVNV